MLPHKTQRGAKALDRVHVCEGIPPPYDKKKRMVVPCCLKTVCLQHGHRYCRLADLSTQVWLLFLLRCAAQTRRLCVHVLEICKFQRRLGVWPGQLGETRQKSNSDSQRAVCAVAGGHAALEEAHAVNSPGQAFLHRSCCACLGGRSAHQVQKPPLRWQSQNDFEARTSRGCSRFDCVRARRWAGSTRRLLLSSSRSVSPRPASTTKPRRSSWLCVPRQRLR